MKHQFTFRGRTVKITNIAKAERDRLFVILEECKETFQKVDSLQKTNSKLSTELARYKTKRKFVQKIRDGVDGTKRLFFKLIVTIIPLGMVLIVYNVLEPDNYWQRLISVVTVALILLVVGFRVIKRAQKV